MATGGNKNAVTIAIIGLIGIVGAAIIANWDKISPPAAEKPTITEKLYAFNCTVQNKRGPVKKAMVGLKGGDAKETGDGGNAIFTGLKEGSIDYSVKYKGAEYNYVKFIGGDLVEIKEIVNLDSEKQGEDTINNKISMPASSINFKEVDQQETPSEVVHESANPDEILSALSLHVAKDFNDQKRFHTRKDYQIAYLYYLRGPETLLNKIKQVNYRRNHNTFPEFSRQPPFKGTNRQTGFSFKGYQWGFISTAYISIILNNDDVSGEVLKDIVYDN